MITQHNPDGLTPEQVGISDAPLVLEIKVCDNGFKAIYHTRLTCAQLRAARWLPPEAVVTATFFGRSVPVFATSVEAPASRIQDTQPIDAATILGKPWRQYLAEQFSATVGHRPLEEWIEQLIRWAGERAMLKGCVALYDASDKLLTHPELRTVLHQWQLAALRTGVYSSLTDVTTAEQWQRAQTEALAAILAERDALRAKVLRIESYPHHKEPFKWMERWLESYNRAQMLGGTPVVDVAAIMSWIYNQPMVAE